MVDLKKQYESLGFVEALIAMMVCGVVSVVLMEISASTLRDLRQLDVQDAIARHAVSTAVHLQEIAIRDKERDTPILGQLQNFSCYRFNTTVGNIVIGSPIPISSIHNVTVRKSYSTSSLVEADSEYFRIFCVKSDPTDTQKILVEVIVGSNKMAGEATSDHDVKDYSYFAVINK